MNSCYIICFLSISRIQCTKLISLQVLLSLEGCIFQKQVNRTMGQQVPETIFQYSYSKETWQHALGMKNSEVEILREIIWSKIAFHSSLIYLKLPGTEVYTTSVPKYSRENWRPAFTYMFTGLCRSWYDVLQLECMKHGQLKFPSVVN